MPRHAGTSLVVLLLTLWFVESTTAAPKYEKKDTWRATLAASFGAGPSEAVARAIKDFPDDRQQLEIVADWILQDQIDGKPEVKDPNWVRNWLYSCEERRAKRLEPFRDKLRRILFTKHYDMGGSHYAYTEGCSDAQAERHFRPGTALCILEMDGIYGRVRPLIEDDKGVIRDPDVSYDGKRVLFAWKKSDREDDYHLYEIDVASEDIRQITHGQWADYEGAYLPDGTIVFNSTRCMQIVDCWWTEVSNLFTCDADGKHLRQISFDQVHTNFPTVTDDGRVIYTRWDYNDRGQIYPQGLFEAKQDGTGQTDLYGNNSFFPTTILHARAIPGTGKILCVFSGHHTRQYGLLGILNPRKGRQENQGAQLIAPVRETKAVHIDGYGRNDPDKYQYPYPLSETDYLVTYRHAKSKQFAVYYMNIDGERELLVSDPSISCNQSIPLCPREVPPVRPNLVDYRKQSGVVYLQDIYAGPGLEGVEPGSIKSLRVVSLDFRAAGVGRNRNSGAAGGALVSTPISISGGSWDVKKVLGTAKIHDDGSACFTVPARVPVYFQALDEKGEMVQSMRSWMTLQPGESVSCVGCHENKNTAPPVTEATLAMRAGPQKLAPFYGPARGFSFIKEIQPILDNKCISCHHLDQPPKYGASGASVKKGAPFDPKKVRTLVKYQGDATWRYTFEKPAKDWNCECFDDSKWAYGIGGFGTAGKVGTRWDTPEIWMRQNFELPKDARLVAPAIVINHDEDAEVYFNGKMALRVKGHIDKYELQPIKPNVRGAIRPGANTLAVHCRQTSGGQYIDVGLVETQPGKIVAGPKPEEKTLTPQDVKPAFSLKGKQTLDKGAARKWSDGYKALANRNICNWIDVQSAPPMLPPYTAGASQSKLIDLLRDGHYGVKLSPGELDRFIVWIDLLVPYAGDYMEAMDENGLPKYKRFLEKRREWHAEEARNIQDYLSVQ